MAVSVPSVEPSSTKTISYSPNDFAISASRAAMPATLCAGRTNDSVILMGRARLRSGARALGAGHFDGKARLIQRECASLPRRDGRDHEAPRLPLETEPPA